MISGPSLIGSNAVVSATTEVAGFEAANLAGERYKKWRSTAVENQQVIVDFENAESQAVGAVLLNDCNLTQDALITWRGYGPAVFEREAGTLDEDDFTVTTSSGSANFATSPGELTLTSFSGTITPKASLFPGLPGAEYLTRSAFTPGYTGGFAAVGESSGGVVFSDGVGLLCIGVTGVLETYNVYQRVAYQAESLALGPLQIWGGLPWGSFPWDGELSQSELETLVRNVLWRLDQVHLLTVVWATITDTDNPDNYLQARELVAAYADTFSIDFPLGIGFVDTTQRGEVARSGLEYIRQPGVIRREFEIDLHCLTDVRVRQAMRSLFMRAGISRPVIFSEGYDSDDYGVRQFGTFLARFDKAPSFNTRAYNYSTGKITLTEVLI